MTVDELTPPPQSAESMTRWVDPESGQEFVMVPVDQFERMQKILDRIALRSGWDDPEMNEYEVYRKKK